MINVNIMHSAFLCHALITKLMQRSQRSAIVFSTSYAGVKMCPGVIIYGATKAFGTYLS